VISGSSFVSATINGVRVYWHLNNHTKVMTINALVAVTNRQEK